MGGSIPIIPHVAHLVLAFTQPSTPEAGAPAEEGEPALQRASTTPGEPAPPDPTETAPPSLEADEAAEPALAPTPSPAPAPAPAPQVTADVEPSPISDDWEGAEPEAQRTVLSGGTRRWFASVYVGGSRPIKNLEYDAVGLTQGGSLALEESFGAHLQDSSAGPSLGIVLQQNFAMLANTYVFAPRFEFDAKLAERYALYVTPSLAAGYKLLDPGGLYDDGDYCYYGVCEEEPNVHQAWVQLAVGIKIIAADRLLLAFRPVALEISTPHLEQAQGEERGENTPTVALRWSLSGGFGLTF